MVYWFWYVVPAIILAFAVQVIFLIRGGVMVRTARQVQTVELKTQEETGSLPEPNLSRKEEWQKFHTTEYEALNKEISDRLKAINSNFQWAATGSAGIFGWLATAKSDELVAIKGTGANWLPLVLATLLGCAVWGMFLSIGEIRLYLRTLERALGAPSLGWQILREDAPSILMPVHIGSWILLIVVDIAGAITLASR